MAKDDKLNDSVTQVQLKVISENGEKFLHKESELRILKVSDNINEVTNCQNAASDSSFTSINFDSSKKTHAYENSKVQVNEKHIITKLLLFILFFCSLFLFSLHRFRKLYIN